MASRHRFLILAILVAAFMQTHLHRLGFPGLVPAIVADLGLTYAAAGTLQAAYFWTYVLVQIPIGILADRWGPRRLMLLCAAALVVGALAFASSGTYPQTLVARMLVGLGAAGVWVPGLRLISEWFPPGERGRATGLLSAGGGVGGTLGLIVLPWLASHWGWRFAYGGTALPALLMLAVIALLVRSGPGRLPERRTAAGNLRRVLTTRAFWPANVSLLFALGGYFSFLTFLPAFLVDRVGVSEAQAGLITGLVTGGTIVSWPLGGLMSDRLGRRKPVYLASGASLGLACLVFAFLVPGWGAAGAAATAVATGLVVAGLIVPFVMVVELFPPELAATASGVTNGASFLGVVVFPIVLGTVIDLTGSFAAAFLLLAAAEGVAVSLGTLLRETGGVGPSQAISRTPSRGTRPAPPSLR